MTYQRREVIGNCTLYLGDTLAVLSEVDTVDALVTDPPYSSGGQFRGDRNQVTSVKYQSTQHHGLYGEFSGDNRDQRSFEHWCALWLSAARMKTKPSGLIAQFTDWRQLPSTSDAMQAGGWVWRGVAVWDKTEASRPQKGRFRGQTEFLAWGSNGSMPVEGPCAPGVFRYSIPGDEKLHITGKPVKLMQDILQLVPDGGVVLDPFMGSATTAIACINRGLGFVGIEIDPGYFDVACQRIERAYQQADLFRDAPQPEQLTIGDTIDGQPTTEGGGDARTKAEAETETELDAPGNGR